MENGFDQPDYTSKNSSCEITDGVGDVIAAIKHDGVGCKSAKEANLEDIKCGVDEVVVGEGKDNKNSKNLETEKTEEMQLDLGDNKEQQKNAGDALDSEVNKFSGKPLHVDKKDAEEAKEELETIDAKEAIDKVKDCGEDYNRDMEDAGVPMEVEEKKDFKKTKDKEGDKIVDDLRNGDEKLVGEQMNVDNNSIIEEVEDIVGERVMQAINDVKDSGEKNENRDEKDNTKDIKENGDSDMEYVREKGTEEVKANKEAKDYEQKKEMGTIINEETTKANEIKDLMTIETEVVKEDATFNEKHEEKESVTSMEFDEENASEEEDVYVDNDGGNIEKVTDDKKLNSLKRKRGIGRGHTEHETEENTKSKEKRESEQHAKDLLSTPLSSRERPVRERKSVERLVEVIEKEPNRTVVIEKGRGTPLKDIPNVAPKLARKKPADLKFLHQALFGRKGKTVDFKNNLLRFSGFAWHESEEKRRVKIKEKLDKCHKDALLDLTNLFDLNVSKSSIKKDEIIVKLLDFLEAPSARTDITVAEEQLAKSRKRKRDVKSSASKSSSGATTENSRKISAKTEDTAKSEGKISKDMKNDDNEEEEKDTENGISDEDDAPRQSESDLKETESLEADEDEKLERDDSAKGKTEVKTTPKQQSSDIPVNRKEGSNSKLSTEMAANSPAKKASPSKPSKLQKDDGSEKVFTRKKRHDQSSKRSKPRPNVEDSSSGKKEKNAVAADRKSGPSKTDLRKTICNILKEVDFNTATFTDILKMLATHYKMDLTSRKPAIKQMIQEELTKMADEAEDEETGEDEDAVKEESPRPAGKKEKV